MVLLLIEVVAGMGQILPFDMRVESTPVKFLRLLNLLLVKNFYVTFLLVVELSFEEVHLPARDWVPSLSKCHSDAHLLLLG